MCSAASYYFNSNPHTEGSAEVMQSVRFGFMKHFGSLAFGSLILTIVGIIKGIFEATVAKA